MARADLWGENGVLKYEELKAKYLEKIIFENKSYAELVDEVNAMFNEQEIKEDNTWEEYKE